MTTAFMMIIAGAALALIGLVLILAQIIHMRRRKRTQADETELIAQKETGEERALKPQGFSGDAANPNLNDAGQEKPAPYEATVKLPR